MHGPRKKVKSVVKSVQCRCPLNDIITTFARIVT